MLLNVNYSNSIHPVNIVSVPLSPSSLLSSFTWLSSQVHSNMVMHFSGRITDSFDREFRCLYADSQIIDCFYNPEEEGMPYLPSYQAMMTPGIGMGMGLSPGLGLDLISDRYKPQMSYSNTFFFTFSATVLFHCRFSLLYFLLQAEGQRLL